MDEESSNINQRDSQLYTLPKSYSLGEMGALGNDRQGRAIQDSLLKSLKRANLKIKEIFLKKVAVVKGRGR
jgi:hypothetical protein